MPFDRRDRVVSALWEKGIDVIKHNIHDGLRVLHNHNVKICGFLFTLHDSLALWIVYILYE